MDAKVAIVDEIAAVCLESAEQWRWIREPLTPGRAQAWLLQHSLRNLWFSSILRPAWMSRCPDQAIVRKTISQMLEEIVHDPNLGYPHTKLMRELGGHIGLSEEQFIHAEPTWQTDLWFNVNENLCRTRHWIVGWLATSLEEFVLLEPGFNVLDDGRWQADLGLTEKQLYFLTYHQVADMEHAGKKVWKPMRSHVTNDEIKADVMKGLHTALQINKIFYDGVAELGDRLDAQGASIPKPK